MTTNDNKNFGDFSDKFECSLCYVTCSCRSECNRHVKTKKHNNNKMTTQISAISAISASLTNSKFDCICGKKYSDRVCLWRHKKKCIFEPQQTTQGLSDYENGSDGFLTNMIIDIVKRDWKNTGDRAAYLVLVIFMNIIGALIYYFAVKRHLDNKKK